MDRNEQQDDLIDLGAVSSETKGPPKGDLEDIAGPRFSGVGGLSND